MTDTRDWPDESQDPPALDAPVGDRMYVPESHLALDGQWVTVRTLDENGHPTFSRALFVVSPEVHKRAQLAGEVVE